MSRVLTTTTQRLYAQRSVVVFFLFFSNYILFLFSLVQSPKNGAAVAILNGNRLCMSVHIVVRTGAKIYLLCFLSAFFKQPCILYVCVFAYSNTSALTLLSVYLTCETTVFCCRLFYFHFF